MILDSLRDKRVVVTGGASGIGGETVKLLLEQGAKVVVGDMNSPEFTDDRMLNVKTNIIEEGDCRTLLAEARRFLGGVDAMVLCAGVIRGSFVPLESFDVETWDTVLDTNVRGSFLCAKHAAPLLRESRGTLVLIASGAGNFGGGSSIAYSSSKAAVSGLGRVLQQNLPECRVLTVCPGGLDTPMKRSVIEKDVQRHGMSEADAKAAMDAQIRGLGDPAGVARVLAFLISEEGSYITGQSLIATR